MAEIKFEIKEIIIIIKVTTVCGIISWEVQLPASANTAMLYGYCGHSETIIRLT